MSPLLDRSIYRPEIVAIEDSSYRLKEVKQRAASKATSRTTRRSTTQHDGYRNDHFPGRLTSFTVLTRLPIPVNNSNGLTKDRA